MEFSTIQWRTWIPDESATLLFVLNGDEILLIRKKRGLGAGKVNGPGGRLEPGETPVQCAIRETREELGVIAHQPRLCGRHRFQFVSGYALQVFVYSSRAFTGTAIETDEAIPLWTPVDAIPYDQMWEDDRIWLPRLLDGELFDGRYLFDDDAMLDYVLEPVARAATLEALTLNA
ncbi:MAG: 8-oxo-dGTP diphosphatase [Gammaproteobacteria bacterium]|nr:8-oxo-dGTP diphosphatase [Gammaproteobacteria bacterium]